MCIPVIFGDNEARLLTLAGIETSGLWLIGEEIQRKLFPQLEPENGEAIFVPFTQIVYLLQGGAPLGSAAKGERGEAKGPARKKKRDSD